MLQLSLAPSVLVLQSSNVATYIANGDVALSVLMTTASTLGAILMTPLLTKLLAGTLVPVDAMVRPFSSLSAKFLENCNNSSILGMFRGTGCD